MKTGVKQADAPVRRARAPSGLRERKKAQRRSALLESARKSFLDIGYDATAIEAIAADCEVSVGTVFNYFPTKPDLLFEVIFTDIRPAFENGFRLVNAAHEGSRGAVLDLLSVYFDWFDGYDRALLRRFAAEAIASPQLDERSYYYLETLFVRQIRAMLQSLDAEDRLEPGIDTEATARLIFNLANSEFYAFLADERIGAADVRDRLRVQLDILWRGLSYDEPPTSARALASKTKKSKK